MLSFAKELFPHNRSLMGPDIRTSMQMFASKHPEFNLIRFKTGTTVFDWEVPMEWTIRESFIEHESGVRYAQFADNNLHLMGYSEPVDKIISRKELLTRIHTHPCDKSAIPYVTSYYKRDWAFCMSADQVEGLPDGKFRVFIDSEFNPGHLCIQEAIIKGSSDQEIFFSSYLCHPSMANNELSGPVLLGKLIDYVRSMGDTRYTYRFVLLAETIGSIAYLSLRHQILKRNVVCGYNLTCVGDERAYSHIESRHGKNLSDIALRSALLGHDNVVTYSFLERGSDERQYCAAGIDLPVSTFCRSKFETYPEYHSNKDDFNVVTAQGLAGSFCVIKSILDSFEFGLYPRIKVLCEPQLSKRGLYPTTSSLHAGQHPAQQLLNVIAYCDGTTTIFDIAIKLNVPLRHVLSYLVELRKHDLVSTFSEANPL